MIRDLMGWVDSHDHLCWIVVGMVAMGLFIEFGCWGLYRMVKSRLDADAKREPSEDDCSWCRGMGLVPTLELTLETTSELFSDEYDVCPICEGSGLKWQSG